MVKVVDVICVFECDWFWVMVDGDGEVFDVLLLDKVFFVYINGKCEIKQQFIDVIVVGCCCYCQIEIQLQDVLLVGDEICVVIGCVLIEMEINNGGFVFLIVYMFVYMYDYGCWSLFVWQVMWCVIEV